MTINKISDGEKLTVAITGRLDTNSSPKLEAELRQSVDGVTELVFDFPRWSTYPPQDFAFCLRHKRS